MKNKLNNRGFAISSIMYLILVVAVLIMVLTLSLLSSRQLLISKQRNIALTNIYGESTNTDFTNTVIDIVPIVVNDSANPWYFVNNAYKSSTYSMDNSTTNLNFEFILENNYTLSFDWSVSSESCCDKFYYTIYKDDTSLSDTGTSTTIKGTTYGETDSTIVFSSVSKSLEPGTYRVEFTYTKDGSQSKGTDAGYVKNLKLEPITS